MRARDVMSSTIISVSAGNSIRHAAEIMLEHDISGVPVLDDNGALVGMLTEGDLLRRCELGGDFSPHRDPTASDTERTREFIKRNAWNVADVMSTSVQTVDANATLADVCEILLRERIKRVPVLSNGRLVGIVSRHDLLKAVVSAPLEPSIVGDDRIRISLIARLRMAEELIGPLPDVDVARGIVRLTGRVRSQTAKEAIRVIAETVAGVAGIEDHTTIGPEDAPA